VFSQQLARFQLASNHIHIIGDLFLAQFAPVKHSSTGEQPAFEIDRLVDSSTGDRQEIWPSAGGAARVAYLLAPYVDQLTLSASLGESSELEALLAARRTRSEAAITLNSLQKKGSIARVLRAYTKNFNDDAGSELWKLAFRVEFPQVLTSSARKLRLDAAKSFVLADYGRGAITANVIADVFRHKPDHVVIFAARRNEEAYRQLPRSNANIVVLCTERSALRWTSLNNPPQTFPLESPSDYLQLLALVLVHLANTFPYVNHFAVICEPAALRCFVFAKDSATKRWSVHYCHGFQENGASIRDRVPGSASAFLAAFARRLLCDGSHDLTNTIVEATRTGVDCVSELLEQGIGFVNGNFGRPEEIKEQLVPSASTSLLATFEPDIAKVVSQTPMATGLLGHAQLYGHLPEIVETLPDYYVPDSQRQRVKAVINTLNSYVTRTNHKRPFNMLLSALPGSGKSHFVHCIARKLRELATSAVNRDELHPLLEFNLSSIDKVPQFEEQLLDIYQDVRDERAAGRMPIVILDEFDSLLTAGDGAANQMSPIFAKMLAPLWDGVFALAKKTRRLGGFVLIMVVSDERFLETLKQGKGIDFESRIDIYFTLAEPTGDEKLEAQVRVALPMLKKHFGDTVTHVELAVLDAIGRADFPRRNRGIDQLFLLSTKPVDQTFRVEHLAPSALIANRIAQNLDLEASIKRFGRSVIRCS
jgi:ATPase family associated with various cellular activities (AAA)